MRALLDVNVLLALLDADHVDHRAARAWLEENIEKGWAVTFDRAIPRSAVSGAAREHLLAL